MLDWLILGVYLAGFSYTMRHIAGRIAWEFGTPDSFDIVTSLFFGAAAAIPWPVSLPIALLTEKGYEPGTKVAVALEMLIRTPESIRVEEMKQRERESQRRIAELEREVGIR